jgi:uncharacterized protein YqjF (DUF2071 family)
MPGSTARPADIIDRIGPTYQPRDRVVMRQNWSDLLFLHWVVPIEQIRPLIPAALDIDTFEGRAYIGLVPFTMTGVRPVWSPSISQLSDFHETNVRTYVHFRGVDPGVWFFSLDAANSIAVRIARAMWKLPYYYASMSLERENPRPSGLEGMASPRRDANDPVTISYRTDRLWPPPLPAACKVRYTPSGMAAPARPGTLEHFLAERYILYTHDERFLYSGRVHHGPYPLQTAQVHSLEESMIAAAGINRGDEPPLAHYARGVNVDVFPLRSVGV